MAVILRSNTDLVYLPDHGFVGEEGALRILPQITRQIHRIDISHNLLGSAGTFTLFKGLSTVRLRHSSPELGLGLWGLREVNLGMNGLDDSSFDCVLAYAKKDVCLNRVLVQGNEITLKNNVESIINSLNSSHISSLSLVNNISIDPDGLIKFVETLQSNSLKQLNISACNLPSSISESISNYLKSSRSRNLESLELNGNQLGREGIIHIIDTVEESNYSIQQLGLLANHIHSSRIMTMDQDDIEMDGTISEQHRLKMKVDEERIMEYQVHRRLPILLERNRILTKRIRQAALRTLVPARILLNASRPSNEQVARTVMGEISGGSTVFVGFPLLDLPEEVIQLIVRHTSDDPWAFSESQWTRMRKEATDKEGLKNIIKLRMERSRGKSREEEREIRRKMKEEWLTRGKWDRWEQ
ncbi:uncharacterized protein IL334_007408 [Kwoniella shivajii]|uniref:F-box domain-containing protein n=1 Tax=Kwoniella shivajii TaxID=564305 RepID=A0ABZ1D936_9TREE|nr:hypothetical protein IL334_007408 [Kwoniella shivajii]